MVRIPPPPPASLPVLRAAFSLHRKQPSFARCAIPLPLWEARLRKEVAVKKELLTVIFLGVLPHAVRRGGGTCLPRQGALRPYMSAEAAGGSTVFFPPLKKPEGPASRDEPCATWPDPSSVPLGGTTEGG